MSPQLGALIKRQTRIPLCVRNGNFAAQEVPIFYRPFAAPWCNWTMTFVLDEEKDEVQTAIIYNGDIARAQFHKRGARAWELIWYDMDDDSQLVELIPSGIRKAVLKFTEVVGSTHTVNYSTKI